jgi:uncharacterized radical SAM protein YgiQ
VNIDTSMTEPLPMSRSEVIRLGWSELDVLIVTGDAYVDHPAFGAALLGRWLVARGYRVGIIAQPRWNSTEDLLAMGAPRLFIGVTAGSLDSMLAHYTAFRKKRSDDAYTPGGRAGARPNRATVVYANLARAAFPHVPIIIGGVEASLRRATHYDFWSGQIRRSILLDGKADLLVYGMAERSILEIAKRLDAIHPSRSENRKTVLQGIPGTACAGSAGSFDFPDNASLLRLPSHEDIVADPKKLMTATLMLEQQVHHGAEWAVQSAGPREVVFAPPAEPLSTDELDVVYALPFTRRPHPRYKQPIPAMEMIQFSVTTHRGCAGGCSFCSLALHQGRRIRSRSAGSLVEEVRRITQHPDWKGSLTDVGGPSANMWGARCDSDPAKCKRTSCLYPGICRNFRPDQKRLARLLHEMEHTSGVRHVRVASGIRHDLALREPEYIRTLVSDFTGGQLKVAPEHICSRVLRLMRKAPFSDFLDFMTVFERASESAGKQQYLVPYLMSAFPGCTDDDMRELAQWLKSRGWRPQQVQCFIPTPGTVATAMYHACIDPDGKPIYVARTDAERLRQHSILAPPPKPGQLGRDRRSTWTKACKRRTTLRPPGPQR